MAIEVGMCKARPGKLSFGYLDALQHFDSAAERLPVVIACGRRDGPCLWVTANIHGNEYVGLLAVQRGVTEALADTLDQLRGTVVAIPTLNPAGLRVGKRQPYYDPHTDPNRTFPDAAKQHGTPEEESEDEGDSPTPYEIVSGIVFERLATTATYHIDLHAMDLQAAPFTLRDQVLYRRRDHPPALRRGTVQLPALDHPRRAARARQQRVPAARVRLPAARPCAHRRTAPDARAGGADDGELTCAACGRTRVS